MAAKDDLGDHTVISGSGATRAPMSLVYCGKDWQLFTGLRLGHSGVKEHLPVWFDAGKGRVVIELKMWLGRPEIPPQRSWLPVLKFLWAGSVYDEKSSILTIPPARFAQSLLINPDSSSQHALGLVIFAVLDECRRTHRNSDWWALLKPEGAATDPESLKKRLQNFILKRTGGHSKRRAALSAKHKAARDRALIPAWLLATSIVSNWPTFRPLGKRSLWIPELAVCASYVSDNFQERIKRINQIKLAIPSTGFLAITASSISSGGVDPK